MILRRRAISEDNLLAHQTELEDIKKPWYSNIWRIFYDNGFFNRLFPLITQQKPGKDLYVFIATVQIVIIFYIFIFYNSMVRTNSDDLASQSSNSLSGEMVAFVLLTLCIMVLDRVLYSTHQFQSR